MGWAAVQALARVTHPAVRALALRLVGTRARWRQRAINLMAQNYEDGDHRIVLRWFQEEEERNALHSMGMDLIGFWERHPDAQTAVLMLRSLLHRGAQPAGQVG